MSLDQKRELGSITNETRAERKKKQQQQLQRSISETDPRRASAPRGIRNGDTIKEAS
jgi:hypothetical protein